MLWVYGHYNFFNSFSAGPSLDVRIRRQILTYKDAPLAERVKNRAYFSGMVLTTLVCSVGA